MGQVIGVSKKISKNGKKMYGLALKIIQNLTNQQKTPPMLAHIRHGIIYCIICFIILSYIVSCILLFYHILYHIVSAICIQSVLPGRQSTQDLLVDYRGDPWSLCPFRPRCHHFRPGPFLSLLRFDTFHLPSFRGSALRSGFRLEIKVLKIPHVYNILQYSII